MSHISRLKSKAKENTSVSVKSSGNSRTLVQGTPLDHAEKHEPQSPCKFGVSKGITKNMDNYESLRVDVWLTDEVQEGDTLDQAFNRVNAILDQQLEEAVSSVIG